MEVDAPDNVDEPENEGEDEIRKREELKQTHQQKMEEYPLWARPLETGSKQVPELRLMNVDRDEGSTRIFGNALVNYIWRNCPDYRKWRTFKAPEQYFREMISHENGRIDMDGICPYNSSTDGVLDFPTMGQIQAWWERRAKPNEHRPENTTCAGRDLESMPMIIRTAMKVEKMMRFMVEAGSTPEDIKTRTPAAEDRYIRIWRVKMWGVIQNFLRRVLKGTFPDKETSSYFRDEDECKHGYGNSTISLPAVSVILIARERNRNIETSICAIHCGVTLPAEMQARVEYAWAYAKLKKDKGHKGRVDRMQPRIGWMKQLDRTHSKMQDSPRLQLHSPQKRARAASNKNMPRPSAGSEPSKAEKPGKSGGWKIMCSWPRPPHDPDPMDECMMDNLATQASWLQIPFYMMAYDFAMVNVGNVIEKTNFWEDSERGIFFNPQRVKTGFAVSHLSRRWIAIRTIPLQLVW